MKFCITNNRGFRLGQHTYPDRKAVRKAARAMVDSGTVVMIYVTDDAGVISRYSSDDTAAVHKKKAPLK